MKKKLGLPEPRDQTEKGAKPRVQECFDALG